MDPKLYHLNIIKRAASLVISGAQVDDVSASAWSAGSTTLAKGSSTYVLITNSADFSSGPKYNFAVLTAGGNKYPYAATKP